MTLDQGLVFAILAALMVFFAPVTAALLAIHAWW